MAGDVTSSADSLAPALSPSNCRCIPHGRHKYRLGETSRALRISVSITGRGGGHRVDLSSLSTALPAEICM